MRANATTGHPSPNDSSLPPDTPFGVTPVIPDFSSVSDPEIVVLNKEHPSNLTSLEKGPISP